jgi:hypothetical protein
MNTSHGSRDTTCHASRPSSNRHSLPRSSSKLLASKFNPPRSACPRVRDVREKRQFFEHPANPYHKHFGLLRIHTRVNSLQRLQTSSSFVAAFHAFDPFQSDWCTRDVFGSRQNLASAIEPRHKYLGSFRLDTRVDSLQRLPLLRSLRPHPRTLHRRNLVEFSCNTLTNTKSSMPFLPSRKTARQVHRVVAINRLTPCAAAVLSRHKHGVSVCLPPKLPRLRTHSLSPVGSPVIRNDSKTSFRLLQRTLSRCAQFQFLSSPNSHQFRKHKICILRRVLNFRSLVGDG